jgi:hypothetical protein
MHLVRLSNILNIETRPFDLATHEAAEAEVVVDDAGKKRVRLRDQNVIRWRVKLPEGAAEEGAAPGIESNARCWGGPCCCIMLAVIYYMHCGGT